MKDAAKEQDEEEKNRKMMSDSTSITDANYAELLPTKSAWLILFYSDDSDESWDLHPVWERVVDELRDLQVPPVPPFSRSATQNHLSFRATRAHIPLRPWGSAVSTSTSTKLRVASSLPSPTCSRLP